MKRVWMQKNKYVCSSTYKYQKKKKLYNYEQYTKMN